MKKKKLNLKDLNPNSEKEHSHDDGHNHGSKPNNFKAYIPAIVSFIMLIVGIALDYFDVAFLKIGFALFGIASLIYQLDFLL